MTAPQVLIVMGSDSDFPVLRETAAVLARFDVSFRMEVCSAHRTPERAHELASTARQQGVKVIIAAAGLAAHLAGVMAASTTLPVLGVPLEGGALHGMDSLYSTVMMPAGVPVATLAIGKPGARNAGLFAVQILSLSSPALADRLQEERRRQAAEVSEKNERLQGELQRYLAGS